MLRLPFVEMRALMAGLTTVPVVALLTTPQAVKFVLVQPVKLNVYPSKIALRPMTSDVSVGTMYSSPFRTNELLLDPVAISNSPFLSRFPPLTPSKINYKKFSECSPEASQVDLTHPDAGVEVAAVEVVVQNRAKVSDQRDAFPAGEAPQGGSYDAEEGHGISEEIGDPGRLVLLPHPRLRNFARQHGGNWALFLRETRARAVVGRENGHWTGSGRRERLSWNDRDTLLEVDGAVRHRALRAHPLVRVAKTGRACVSEAEADDALRGGKRVLGLHDRGGEGIGRGGRTAGDGTN